MQVDLSAYAFGTFIHSATTFPSTMQCTTTRIPTPKEILFSKKYGPYEFLNIWPTSVYINKLIPYRNTTFILFLLAAGVYEFSVYYPNFAEIIEELLPLKILAP